MAAARTLHRIRPTAQRPRSRKSRARRVVSYPRSLALERVLRVRALTNKLTRPNRLVMDTDNLTMDPQAADTMDSLDMRLRPGGLVVAVWA
jgi:hypothetical protein